MRSTRPIQPVWMKLPPQWLSLRGDGTVRSLCNAHRASRHCMHAHSVCTPGTYGMYLPGHVPNQLSNLRRCCTHDEPSRLRLMLNSHVVKSNEDPAHLSSAFHLMSSHIPCRVKLCWKRPVALWSVLRRSHVPVYRSQKETKERNPCNAISLVRRRRISASSSRGTLPEGA